jgi:predicted LPLAT superfamily acyltransferase
VNSRDRSNAEPAAARGQGAAANDASGHSGPAPGRVPDWSKQPERSNLWTLRLMRFIALAAGRTVSRWVLHPITLYFLIVNGKARRESARYLGRVLGRPARWRDVYRHIHTFSATVLDRVYLLQERCDTLALRTTGMDVMDAPIASGRGALMVGAHLGSFEALRAHGQGLGLNVAMVMYEDNAQLINSTLAAIAPHTRLHTIALGRVDAMLALRDWLDQGGIAGLLADRTLPGHSDRSRTHWLPFLGQPARFSDGPFRLAALLRRPVVFMTGLYHGGRQYELRFSMLADFSQRSAAGGPSTDQRIEQALQAYVALVEALCREMPYNWFNFYDFWAADANAPTPVVL